MKTDRTPSTRRLRWLLAPVTLALLAACGGSDGEDSLGATDQAVAAAPTDDASAAREGAMAVTPTSFRHPGIFLTQARLDTFKAVQNSADDSVLKTGYQVVLNDSRSAYTYSHKALSNVQVVGSAIGDQEARYKNDAQAAYLNALRWVKTGDVRHRDKAVAILNDWARTFRTYSVASGTNAAQVQLEAAWMLPVWVSAASRAPSERPVFITTMGLPAFSAAAAAVMN